MIPQDMWVRDRQQADEPAATEPTLDAGAEPRAGDFSVSPTDVDQLPTEKMPAMDGSKPATVRVGAAMLEPVGFGLDDEDTVRRLAVAPDAAPRIPSSESLALIGPGLPDTVAKRSMRRGPRRLLVAVLLVALLLVVAAVPLLRVLQAPAAAHESPTALPSPTPTALPTGLGMADPKSYTWLGNLNGYAERAYVDSILSGMTLDEELGQMIQVSFYDQTTVPQWALDEIARDHIGSVILYQANLATADSARDWTTKLQSAAKIPLLLGTDEEGGGVNRLSGIYGDMTSAWQIAQRNDPDYARRAGMQFAQDLAALGMNSDYAPVVDVDSGTGAAGGELNGRMFGNNPGQVTTLAGAFLQGLQYGNHVAGCLKHFPGLGDSTADPHQKLATVDRSLDDLWRIDWAPYKALIATGQVAMIMTTHVVISAVDTDRPASLSRKVVTGILRDQLHFDGVIITDGVYMLQKQGSYDYDQSVLYAIEAGNDIVSAATSAGGADEALRVLRQGVESGQISKQQIDDSVRRILLLKLHYGLFAKA